MNHYIELHNEIMENDKAEKIEYNISVNYVKNLTAVFGIKEIIANFYDANGENFTMNFDKRKLLIEDQNSGIDIKYMIIGNSGSREAVEKIGEHGEGFKVGALTLVRLGYKVLIETVGYTIVFGIEHSSLLNSEVMFAKYVKNDKEIGTTVYLECTKQSYEKARDMFLFLSDYKEVTKNIIDMEGSQKNIYINGLSHTAKKSFFAYNLTEKNLVSRDRNFISFPILKEKIIEIYENLSDEDAIATVMEQVMNNQKQFDKMLEAKILPEIRLTYHQMEMYRQHVSPDDVYVKKGSSSTLDTEGKTIVKVDTSLFNFMSLIGANTYEEETRSKKIKNGEVKELRYKKELLPNSLDVELATVSLMKEFFTMENGKTTFQSNPSSLYSMFKGVHVDSFFENYRRSYKAANKPETTNDLTRFVTNNLLLLACHDFQVSIFSDEFEYRFEKEDSKDEITIRIVKVKAKTESHKVKAFVSKDIEFENGLRSDSKNFIYLGHLRGKEISSFYSYQFTTYHQYDNRESSATNLLQKLINKKSKQFFEMYVNNLKTPTAFEYSLNLEVNNRSKKVFENVFNKKYPNHVIASEVDVYDSVVSHNHGYQLLFISSNKAKNFLRYQIGIKDTETIFIEKQHQAIHAIEPTEIFKEAISIFEEMTGEKPDIYLTPILPNGVESLSKNGKIYINQLSSNVPIYIASLIAYEHIAITKKYKKASHSMQNELTHYVLS